MGQHTQGGYCAANLTQWLVFSYGPAEWTGVRKPGNAVDVLHAFRISGNVEEHIVQGVETRRTVTQDGNTVAEEVQVVKVMKRFVPGPSKEKLFVGWTGWGPDDWCFLVNTGRFRRGIFAEKAGGPEPQFYALRRSTQMNVCGKCSVLCSVFVLAPYSAS